MKPIDLVALAKVTGGAEAVPVWIARPPMASVPSGFNAWSESMRRRGLV